MNKQFRLLTDWYLSVIENIQPADGRHIVSPNTNSLEWLAGHLIVVRCRNIGRLGQSVEPFQYLDDYVDQTLPPPNFRPFDPTRTYPSLAECARHWAFYSDIFLRVLATADEPVLKAELPIQGPTGGTTVEDFLTSNVLHESFHIGQMSIIRKSLGYQAMYWFHRAS